MNRPGVLILNGLIERRGRGLIDDEQADATWGQQRHARADVVSGLDEEEEELCDRAAYLAASLAEMSAVRARLAEIPERRAAELAAAMGCPVETARTILAVLMGHIDVDLGDTAAEITAATGMTMLSEVRSELHALSERRSRLTLRVRTGELVPRRRLLHHWTE